MGVGAQGEEETSDPFERANRAVFAFNDALDRALLAPTARAYRLVTPPWVRAGLRNVLDNLRSPVVLANDLLQAEPRRASETTGRFMLNTILGVGGLIDVGGLLSMTVGHDEDFGQTLAVYGIGSGPYLMLPVLGQFNPHHLVGQVVDFAFDPRSFLAPSNVSLARTGADMFAFREANIETIDEFRRISLDLYAATRTLTHQLRTSEIHNGTPADVDTVENEAFDDPGDAEVNGSS